MYHISENGTDQSSCGKTENSACTSLKYVLGIYYNRSESSQRGLSIITSRPLTFNQQLMVSQNEMGKDRVKQCLMSGIQSSTP